MARERRKVRVGRVVRDKMDKTVVVAVRWEKRHRLYRKSLRRIARFYAHDNDNRCRLGDLVRIEETRPISRMKRWRVLAIVERREVAEVKPIELDEGLLSEDSDVEEDLQEDLEEEQEELERDQEEEIEDQGEDQEEGPEGESEEEDQT